MNIYLASSWRNPEQPRVLQVLRDAGHKVYDFRQPLPGEYGFHWTDIDPAGHPRTVDAYRRCIAHPIADKGFKLDMDALKACDACVLLLPSGRSAHLEAGWAVGTCRRVVVYTRDGEEPELMYKMCAAIVASDAELIEALAPACWKCSGTRKWPFPGFAVGLPWSDEPCGVCSAEAPR